MIIYKITNKINGKCYIGQTIKTLRERTLRHYRGNRQYIDKSIKKYGKDNFIVEELCTCDNMGELNELEQFTIEICDSQFPNGYNITSGGKNQHNFKMSNESKLKMSKKAKGRIPWNKGIPCREETKKKLSDVLMGRIISDETKKKMSIGTEPNSGSFKKGNIPWNKGLKKNK